MMPTSSKTNPLNRLRSETNAIRQTITASIAAFTLASKIRRLSDVGVESNPRLGLVMSKGLLSNSNLLIVLLPSKCRYGSTPLKYRLLGEKVGDHFGPPALLAERALEASGGHV